MYEWLKRQLRKLFGIKSPSDYFFPRETREQAYQRGYEQGRLDAKIAQAMREILLENKSRDESR